ncbi:MAG: tRNA epoxyqueuosine(34) reductase QueG [Myxococcales bacterium]
METVPKSEAEQAENFLDQNAEQFQPSNSVEPARDRDEFRSRLAVRAREQGFVRIGVAPADPFLEAGQRFRDWLHQGFAGDMEYLAEFGCRADPGRLLANARSVVVAAAALPRRSEPSTTAASAPTGIVADYALGLDYHIALRSRLRRIGQALADLSGRAVWTRPCIDTAPLLEREAARRAGVGFIAKSTMLIVPGIGPRVLLASLVTDLELWSEPIEKDRCGRCTACIDACPTNAFVGPYRLDARRCLSYLTIEHQGSLPEATRRALDNRLIGCDVCQTVCPYDRTDSAEVMPSEMTPRAALANPDLIRWLEMSASDYRRITKRSALRRVGRVQLMRNAAVAIGNSRSPQALAALERALFSNKSPLVRAHAAWALGRYGSDHAKACLRRALDVESDTSTRGEILAALEHQTA